ncbi:stage III sporulation protein AE [uncultured Ruminococcus sp.]|uniref:stage III sporulation protein AE n=1 Tax=uncultured Ruminococcus sp. TaxID=165186 RepID=UPI002639CC2F|nr:hypothetical protein [uncultured Ruminococcus sp.]
MKRSFGMLFIIILLLFFAVPVRANAEDETASGSCFCTELDGILSDNDIGYSTDELTDMSFSQLSGEVADRVSVRGLPALLGTIILVTVITAAVRSAGTLSPSNSDISGTVSVLAAVTVISPHLFDVMGASVEAVQTGGAFIAVFIPVFAGVTAAMGGITSAGIYDMAVLAASELIVQLTGSLLMPIVRASVMLSATGSVFGGEGLGSLVKLIKKLITWTMTVAMTLFSGLLTLKCTLAGKADGAASKTTRFVISGLVPVVGGAVNDAYSTVRGSIDIVRSSVGTAGCIAVALIFLPPIIQLLLFRAVMWTGAAVGELFSVESMSELLRSLDAALAIVQAVLVCYGMMFILSSAILLQTAGG